MMLDTTKLCIQIHRIRSRDDFTLKLCVVTRQNFPRKIIIKSECNISDVMQEV
jgi:hypothetical protein